MDERGLRRTRTCGKTRGEPDAVEVARPVRRGGPGKQRAETPALRPGPTPYEWLARRLDEAGIGYVRYDNALVKIDNLEAACELCERFAHRAWPGVLNAFARMVNPIMPIVQAAGYGGYYWVLDQAEIATDVMFRTPLSWTSGPTWSVTPPSTWAPKTWWGSWAASCTRRWRPKW